MTSSLVGSEMCIRDRSPGRPSSPGSHRCNTLRWRHDRDPGKRRFFCPVSYTHLTLPTICSV
eukprot:6700626-Prorocentrum_lima.AAC.1